VIGLLCCGLALGHTSSHKPVAPGFEWPEWQPNPENPFRAVLLLSDNPDEILRSWTTPDPRIPARTTDTIAPGVPIVAFVFFTGCRPDENGLCNASVDFTVLGPDGSVCERATDRDLWKRKPAPPIGTLRLSAEYVGLIIEPDDPLGRYEVQVSVHDLNAGTTLKLTRAFIATDR
jgi:hypothetical protein